MRDLFIISGPILETSQLPQIKDDLENSYYLKDKEQLITSLFFTNYDDQIRKDSLNIPLLKNAGASWIFFNQFKNIIGVDWKNIYFLSENPCLMSLSPLFSQSQFHGIWYNEKGEINFSDTFFLYLWSYKKEYGEVISFLGENQNKSLEKYISNQIFKYINKNSLYYKNNLTSLKLEQNEINEYIPFLLNDLKMAVKVINNKNRQSENLIFEVESTSFKSIPVRLCYLDSLFERQKENTIKRFKQNLGFLLKEIERISRQQSFEINTGDLSLVL